MPLLVLKRTMGWYYFPGMKDLVSKLSARSKWVGNLTKNLWAQSAVKTIDGPLKVFAAAIKNRWQKWERKLKMHQGPRLEFALQVRCEQIYIWKCYNLQHGSNWRARNGKINILLPIQSKLVSQSLFVRGNHSPIQKVFHQHSKIFQLKDLFPQIVLFQMKF